MGSCDVPFVVLASHKWRSCLLRCVEVMWMWMDADGGWGLWMCGWRGGCRWICAVTDTNGFDGFIVMQQKCLHTTWIIQLGFYCTAERSHRCCWVHEWYVSLEWNHSRHISIDGLSCQTRAIPLRSHSLPCLSEWECDMVCGTFRIWERLKSSIMCFIKKICHFYIMFSPLYR